MICPTLWGAPESSPLPADLTAVPFGQVTVRDRLWAPWRERMDRVTLPHCLVKTEPAVENLRRTAHFLSGVPDRMPVRSLFLVSDLYKVMEAAAYSLQVTPDPLLEARMDSIIGWIAGAQRSDGYMYEAHVCGIPDTAEMGSRPYERLISSHELYNMGHLYEAAVAYSRATGKDRLLAVAEKHARHVNRAFFEGDPNYNGGRPINHISGHPEIELALCKLFGQTRDSLYLRMAQRFVTIRGTDPPAHFTGDLSKSQEHIPLREQYEPVGHAVCAAYIYSGMADVDALCGTQHYRVPLDSIWENLVRTRIALTGGLGAVRGLEGFGPPYSLPNKNSYNETCASVANVLFNDRMFRSRHDGRYFDVLECALFNGALAGINLAGDRFFYVNPLEADGLQPFNLGQKGRSSWFGCACCPPNIARLLMQVPGLMYYHTGRDIYLTLYGSSSTEVPLADGTVAVEQTSDYPFSGESTIVLTPANPMTFALRLRIPTWARGGEFLPGGLYPYADAASGRWTVKVNGKPVDVPLEEGFAVIDRRWRPGDRVELSLPMQPRYGQARPEVKADVDRVAVVCGPLVYCAEEPDNGLVQRYYLSELPALRRSLIEEGLLKGLPAVDLTASRLDTTVRLPLRLIPYYAWDNRGDLSMAVWLPRTGALAQESLPRTEKNKVWLKEVRFTCNDDQPFRDAIFDGMTPERSHHQGYPCWTSRGCEGQFQQVEFLFTRPRSLAGLSVYWISDARTTTLLPDSWSLEYLLDGRWLPFPRYVTDLYGLEVDQFNDVRPAGELVCEGLRMQIEPRSGHSVGMAEVRIDFVP